MNYLLLVLVLACSSCAIAQDATPAAEAPPDPTATDWLERIEARADEIETLTARIRLEQITGLLGDEQVQVGTLTYAAGPPPRFAVRFKGHIINDALRQRDRRYVFDGRWLGEFNGDDKTLIRYELVTRDEAAEKLFALGEGPFPLPLDMDKQAVLRQFHVSLVEETEDAVTLGFEARREDDRFKNIDIRYNRKTLLPERIEAVHGEDETNVDLRDVQVNIEVEADTFSTTPPGDDWTVQDNPAGP